MTQATPLHGWNRRSFLANLGAGALALVGLASPSPLLRRSWAAGTTTKLVSTWNAFDVLDPHVKYDVPAAAFNLNIYDNLLRYQGNPPQLVPWLAERDEAADGGRRWRFYLRPGVTFHDGSPLTAEAVRFSFERLLALGKGPSGVFKRMGLTAEHIRRAGPRDGGVHPRSTLRSLPPGDSGRVHCESNPDQGQRTEWRLGRKMAGPQRCGLRGLSSGQDRSRHRIHHGALP